VITGGASGIGLAAAKAMRARGLRVVIADLGVDRLAKARAEIGGSDEEILAIETDVSRPEALAALEDTVHARFGGTDVLMNNAGIARPTSAASAAGWLDTLAVNLWGVVHGTHAFLPRMRARKRPGLVINTGSKQGITTPPGNPAYNVSKAALKVFTEALAHELRNAEDVLDGGRPRIGVHLLIPGFVFTPLASGGRSDKPAGAWTAEQTVDFMLERLEAGDFYILCPDGETSRALDERRILWAAGDLVENRPPLSRWHPDFAEAFKAFATGPR